MIRADLIEINKELFQKLKRVGIKLDDYRYCDLYRDYQQMAREGYSRKVIFITLSERYGISDRQAYNIVNHFKAPVNPYLK